MSKILDNEHGRDLWIMDTGECPAEDLLIIEIENAVTVKKGQNVFFKGKTLGAATVIFLFLEERKK